MADFLEGQQQQIQARIQELAPAVAEYERLEAALAALAGLNGGGSSTSEPAAAVPARKRGPGRPRGSGSKPAAKAAGAKAAPKRRGAAAPRTGRRKGSGTRAAEALAHVIEHPGIAIGDLAEKMGIKQNYLYRVLPGLEGEKKVHKKGRGWHPGAA